MKTPVTYISTTPGDNCKILSDFSLTFLVSANSAISKVISSFNLVTGITPSIEGVQYYQSYFSTYEQCLSSLTGDPLTCEFSFDGLEGYLASCSNNFGISCYGFPTTVNDSSATNLVNKFLVSAVLCEPFKSIPPYQCTSLQPLSTLNILSQSFALTTTAIGVLFFASVLFVKFRPARGDPMLWFETIYSAKPPATNANKPDSMA